MSISSTRFGATMPLQTSQPKAAPQFSAAVRSQAAVFPSDTVYTRTVNKAREAFRNAISNASSSAVRGGHWESLQEKTFQALEELIGLLKNYDQGLKADASNSAAKAKQAEVLKLIVKNIKDQSVLSRKHATQLSDNLLETGIFKSLDPASLREIMAAIRIRQRAS